MIYIQLFLSFLQIGLFSVGGGYAAIPLVQSLIVERQGWITMTEFTNLITIAEMTPGPIAVNSATFVGIRIAGLPGAVAATWGCIFPGAGLSMLLAAVLPEVNGERMIQWGSLVLFSAAFIALRKWKLNPILVMWVCGGVSLAVKLIEYHL